MNSSKKEKHAASPAKYAIIAVIAAIAGFATVYWSLAPSDNGSGSGSAPEMVGEAGAGSEADAKASPLKGLNKGAMAAFLVRSKPLDLPDFSLVNGDGATISLADLGGKVVLLNIWATWCVPCREEMPQLNDLQAALGGKDFEVVAVNIDKGGPAKARKFLEETKAADLTLYTDPTGKLFSKLRAVGMPTTLLIDRDSKEIGRLVGPADWASAEAKRLIRAAIAASKPVG
ncbi:MAG: TlpA family protein disulfide reductase [Methyloceanibacter sp.]